MTNIVKLLLEKDLDNMPQIDKAYSIQKVCRYTYLFIHLVRFSRGEIARLTSPVANVDMSDEWGRDRWVPRCDV